MELIQHLPGLHHASAFLYIFISAVGFAILAFWSVKAGNSESTQHQIRFWQRVFRLPEGAVLLPGALFLAFAMMLTFSPHYPWYVAWLIPFGVVLPNLPIFTYMLGLFYLSATPLGAGTTESQYRPNCILCAAVLIAGVLEWMVRAGYA